ncbi:MAG: hypothetical protein FK734_21495, partial [Asgard group archaeon]|nr:hypothetical protein [Asgard group archaeon]
MLKKQSLSFIPLFILLFFSYNHIPPIRSDFNIPTGATYTYDVINSYWHITQGVNTGEGFGFNFEGTSYNLTTQIVTKTRMVNPQNITYAISVDSATIEAYDTSLELVSWFFLMQYPMLKAQASLSPWNQVEIEKGPVMFNQFFIEPTTFSDACIYLSNDTFVYEQFTNNAFIDKHIHGHFDNSSS